MATTLSAELTQTATALIRTVNGSSPIPEVLFQQLWDLANVCEQAKANNSFNLLARAHAAVKESTRGFMNLMTRHGQPDVISHFLSLFPLDVQYADEFLQVIYESEILNVSDKNRLHNSLVSNVIKHETFSQQDKFGGTPYGDARRFLIANLVGFDGGVAVEASPLSRICEHLCESRNDGTAAIISVLNLPEDARSESRKPGYQALECWFNEQQTLMIAAVLRNQASEYNTFSVVELAKNAYKAPHLACCLNLRSNEPDFQSLIEGLTTYGLRADESFKKTMAYDSGGEFKRVLPENTLEALIAYSLTVENVLPDVIIPGPKFNLITALVNAGREVAKPEYHSLEHKSKAQSVVDFVMDRVTGNENFSLMESSWLLPYAQKNLTYLKHAFSRDLGL
jgi:hypothetical protein